MINYKSKNYEPELVRQLNLFDSTMMMIGLVIGSGIFLTTGIMAQSIPSAGLILLAWLFGGFLTLAGALTFAEIGAAMPEAGGQYIYLREAYGHLFGFLFGWVLFLVAMGGSIAALAVGLAIILQLIWTCILTVSGTYEQLFTFTMFTTIIFWIAGTASVFTLRRKFPEMERPYKTWGIRGCQ